MQILLPREGCEIVLSILRELLIEYLLEKPKNQILGNPYQPFFSFDGKNLRSTKPNDN